MIVAASSADEALARRHVRASSLVSVSRPSLWSNNYRALVEQLTPDKETGPTTFPLLDLYRLRGQDLNLRPSGYEPDELPDCSTPRWATDLDTAGWGAFLPQQLGNAFP